MALIQCPECGMQVSDSAKQCVHCGFSFQVCPECGNVVGKDISCCSRCGYEFKKEEKSTESFDFSATTDTKLSEQIKDNYIAAWEKTSSFAKYSKPAEKIIKISLRCLSVLMFVILAVKFLSYAFASNLEQLEKVTGLMSGGKALIVLGCLFFGLTFPVGILLDTFRNTLLCDWMKRHNLDPVKGIKHYGASMNYEELSNCNTMIEAGFMSVYPPIKNQHYIVVGLLFAFCVPLSICFGLFLAQNFEAYFMAKVLLEGAVKFQFQWKMLVVSVVLGIALIVVLCAGFRAIGKKEELWIDKVYPGLNKIREEKLQQMIDAM